MRSATPLITNSDGTKFGKTEGSAIWLDAALTAPYAFFQFWLNTDDADVIERVKIFTFLSRAEIERLEGLVACRAGRRREAQRALARSHRTGARRGGAAPGGGRGRALFGREDLAALGERNPGGGAGGRPGHARARLRRRAPRLVAQLLQRTGLVSFAVGGPPHRRPRAAPTSTTSGSPTAATSRPTPRPGCPAGWLVLRRGRRTVAGVHRTVS